MTGRIRYKIHLGFRIFLRQIVDLMKQPVFIAITILGNMCILAGTAALYYVEHEINPKLHSALDAIWWAVATVSTVGYGDVSPVTSTGKLVGIGMMIVGTALFSAYTALFASAILTVELSDVEKEVRDIEKKIQTDEESIRSVIQTVESALAELRAIKIKKH
jgi:voltage-gated potassium channel